MSDQTTIDLPGAPIKTIAHRLAITGLAGSDSGVLSATLSSETPVGRERGDEILVHTLAAVNMERAAMGLSLLIDHDPGRQLGRVENIRLVNRKLVGDIRLSERADAADIVADIRAGLRPDISIGYTVDKIEPVPGGAAYHVVRWTLFEISSVAIPADFTVGIGRSLKPTQRKVLTMTTNSDTPPAPAGGDLVAAERLRVQNIRAIASRIPDAAPFIDQAIGQGWTVDRLASEVDRTSRKAPAPNYAEAPSDGHFEREASQFSMVRAIAASIENGGRLTGREREISDELVRRNGGHKPKGFLVPTSVLATRVQTVGTAIAGGNLVANEFHPEMYVQPFRNRCAVMQLGATVLEGLTGNAILPRQDTATAGAWVLEDTAAAETTLNWSQLTLTPKTVSGNISWSRQAALQATPAMDSIVTGDLAAQIAIALDRAAIHGAGTGAEPKGILNFAGIGSVALGTNGAAATYASILDLEAQVANANADGGNMGYLTNTKVRRALKSTQRFASTDSPVWLPAAPGADPTSGMVNGFAAYASNNVRSDFTKGSGTNLSAMIFGNWSELIIGLWGALDLIVDPYSFSDKGRVRITAFLAADIQLRHPQSFAAFTDAIA